MSWLTVSIPPVASIDDDDDDDAMCNTMPRSADAGSDDIVELV